MAKVAKKGKAEDEIPGIEFIQDSEALKKEVFKAEHFLEKNKTVVGAILAAIILVVAGIFGYNYWNKTKDKEAQAALFDAVYSFEADSLSQALKGQGGNEGLLAVAENYGSTKAGNLANLYAGIALMKEAKFQEAINHLDKFSANDDVLQPRSFTLIGDSYMELNKTEDAIKYYKKAADYNPNKYATPGMMMKLGLAYQVAKKNADAVKVYGTLIDKYPSAIEAVMAKKYKALLEAEGGN